MFGIGGESAMAKHSIFYRRPESPGSLARQTTPTTEEAITQVERLAALGYLVVDVEPKIPVESGVTQE
jgi:hypothetical protein